MRILLVTSRYPWPPRRGDQLRTCQLLDLLAPEHSTTLLTPEPAEGRPPSIPPGVEEVVTYRPAGGAGGWARAALLAATGLPAQSGLFHSPDLARKLRLLAPAADLGILQLVRLAAHRGDFGATPVVVDLIDDLALNFARRAAVDRPWLRPAWTLEARLLLGAERRLARGAAAVLLVCDRDRRELARHLPPEDRSRLATVGLVAEPAAVAPDAAAEREGARIVFTGNLGYFVNADAITWWLRAVWPGLAARRPELRLVVAGDRPAAAVARETARAAAASGRVTLAPAVPELRRLLDGAAVALAPMRCGSGIPIKILEAWGAGVPVVASPWAAAGTTAVAGRDLAVVDSPREWEDTLCRLLDEPAERARLAANGRQRLLADYSRDEVQRQLFAALAAAANH